MLSQTSPPPPSFLSFPPFSPTFFHIGVLLAGYIHFYRNKCIELHFLALLPLPYQLGNHPYHYHLALVVLESLSHLTLKHLGPLTQVILEASQLAEPGLSCSNDVKRDQCEVFLVQSLLPANQLVWWVTVLLTEYHS